MEKYKIVDISSIPPLIKITKKYDIISKLPKGKALRIKCTDSIFARKESQRILTNINRKERHLYNFTVHTRVRHEIDGVYLYILKVR